MKKLATISLLVLVFACAKTTIERPDNLIGESKMKDIIYDLSLLEAIKSQKPIALDTNDISANQYIYKKYKIDSVQFAKSNQYYASDVVNYKKMYDDVAKRVEKNKTQLDSVLKANGGIPAPASQDAGVVK